MQDKPLVTVLITTYNRPKYVVKAIESAQKQDYPNLEVLVIDDGSDSREWLNQIPDDSVRYVYTPHRGQPHAMIKGMQEASGKYVAILDSDDELTPQSIECRLKGFRDGVGLVYGDINYIDEQGTFSYSQEYREFSDIDKFIDACLVGPIVPIKHSGIMFRKEAIDQVGNYDPNRRFLFDIDLIVRVAKKFGISHVRETVVNYRVHAGNISANPSDKLQSIQELRSIIDGNIESKARGWYLKQMASLVAMAKASYLKFTYSRPQWLINLGNR